MEEEKKYSLGWLRDAIFAPKEAASCRTYTLKSTGLEDTKED